MISYAAQLRQELCARNAAYAKARNLLHVCSLGEPSVIVYPPDETGRLHGNFHSTSYSAILKQPEWKRRLGKVHAQGRSLPKADRPWCELDSCMSSDALLMNVFCHPFVLRSPAVQFLLGMEDKASPKFGFPARVPLMGERTDRTEVDMILGRLLVEAKLTESDFQCQTPRIVEAYRDLDLVFDRKCLPRVREQYGCHQLIRNVLAAFYLNFSFCVFLDSRRPDLLESWYTVMSCIKIAELRTRCKVLTWQELSEALPRSLQKFLESKYGISPPRSGMK